MAFGFLPEQRAVFVAELLFDKAGFPGLRDKLTSAVVTIDGVGIEASLASSEVAGRLVWDCEAQFLLAINRPTTCTELDVRVGRASARWSIGWRIDPPVEVRPDSIEQAKNGFYFTL